MLAAKGMLSWCWYMLIRLADLNHLIVCIFILYHCRLFLVISLDGNCSSIRSLVCTVFYFNFLKLSLRQLTNKLTIWVWKWHRSQSEMICFFFVSKTDLHILISNLWTCVHPANSLVECKNVTDQIKYGHHFYSDALKPCQDVKGTPLDFSILSIFKIYFIWSYVAYQS